MSHEYDTLDLLQYIVVLQIAIEGYAEKLGGHHTLLHECETLKDGIAQDFNISFVDVHNTVHNASRRVIDSGVTTRASASFVFDELLGAFEEGDTRV